MNLGQHLVHLAQNTGKTVPIIKLDVTLDTAQHRITGSVTITYTNNSPDALSFLWLQTDQNIYREDSRGQAASVLKAGVLQIHLLPKGMK
jgi:hypothetical protein